MLNTYTGILNIWSTPKRTVKELAKVHRWVIGNVCFLQVVYAAQYLHLSESGVKNLCRGYRGETSDGMRDYPPADGCYMVTIDRPLTSHQKSVVTALRTGAKSYKDIVGILPQINENSIQSTLKGLRDVRRKVAIVELVGNRRPYRYGLTKEYLKSC